MLFTLFVFVLGMIAAYALMTFWPAGWKWFVAIVAAGFAMAANGWDRLASLIGG